MAKRVCKKAEWLSVGLVTDIYSISGCISHDFADYIEYWKHNGFWLFNSPEIIREIAREESVDLAETSLFYYEVYDREFDGESWHPYEPEASFPTQILVPSSKQLEGFDVATFSCRNVPEHSPLSCNYLANEILTNTHCLFCSFDEAKTQLELGAFNNSEPGPYRIFAVYSVNWP
ncbi:MAG TPA: hypothetical protein VLY23_08640 [Candidatus Acidoferrum sp.]|nr:hypothetical protein [Candidatus Acidoferrum sp.]